LVDTFNPEQNDHCQRRSWRTACALSATTWCGIKGAFAQEQGWLKSKRGIKVVTIMWAQEWRRMERVACETDTGFW
jgi:hypothetical protein